MASFLSKDFFLGIALLLVTAFGYPVVTNYFYYSGGWPFVPIIFLIVYLIGVRFIFKSRIHLVIKLILCLAVIAWTISSEDLYLN